MVRMSLGFIEILILAGLLALLIVVFSSQGVREKLGRVLAWTLVVVILLAVPLALGGWLLLVRNHARPVVRLTPGEGEAAHMFQPPDVARNRPPAPAAAPKPGTHDGHPALAKARNKTHRLHVAQRDAPTEEPLGGEASAESAPDEPPEQLAESQAAPDPGESLEAASPPPGGSEMDEASESPPPAPETADTEAVGADEENGQPALPEWVDQQPGMVDGAYQMSVSIGPYTSEVECLRELSPAVSAAVEDYIARYLDKDAGVRISLPWQYIEEHVIADRVFQKRIVDISTSERAEMVQMHVLLRFNHQTNAQIRQAVQEQTHLQHVMIAGFVAAGLLWLICVLWSYLRLDLATQGRYRKWLRLAVAALMLLPVSAVILVA